VTPASVPLVPARTEPSRGDAPLDPPLRDRVVGIGTYVVSADRSERLVAYALGSGLAVAIYDPMVGVGGLLHAMRPSAALGTGPAAQFVDAGTQEMVRAAYRLGAAKGRLVVKIIGGAECDGGDATNPGAGPGNVQALRRLLWRNNVRLTAESTGGRGVLRTASLIVANGEVQVKVDGHVMPL
jgi:chemotaxis protein CheD